MEDKDVGEDNKVGSKINSDKRRRSPSAVGRIICAIVRVNFGPHFMGGGGGEDGGQMDERTLAIHKSISELKIYLVRWNCYDVMCENVNNICEAAHCYIVSVALDKN